jgi:hypothetical protein
MLCLLRWSGQGRPEFGTGLNALRSSGNWGDQGVSFVLEDGTKGGFPADLVLYHTDPSYDRSPINQLKRTLKGELAKSKLSVRVLADALKTSPAQVVRLLEENRGSKHLLQLFKLAELAGYSVEFRLRKKSAA